MPQIWSHSLLSGRHKMQSVLQNTLPQWRTEWRFLTVSWHSPVRWSDWSACCCLATDGCILTESLWQISNWSRINDAVPQCDWNGSEQLMDSMTSLCGCLEMVTSHLSLRYQSQLKRWSINQSLKQSEHLLMFKLSISPFSSSFHCYFLFHMMCGFVLSAGSSLKCLVQD